MTGGVSRLRALAEAVPEEDRWHIDIPVSPEVVSALCDVYESAVAYLRDDHGCSHINGPCTLEPLMAALARLEET